MSHFHSTGRAYCRYSAEIAMLGPLFGMILILLAIIIGGWQW